MKRDAYWFRSSVFPETKGVPLEEMDEVFGEGALPFETRRIFTRLNHIIEERQERLEDSDDSDSLSYPIVGDCEPARYLSTEDGRGSSDSREREQSHRSGWFAQILNRLHHSGSRRYESVPQESN